MSWSEIFIFLGIYALLLLTFHSIVYIIKYLRNKGE